MLRHGTGRKGCGWFRFVIVLGLAWLMTTKATAGPTRTIDLADFWDMEEEHAELFSGTPRPAPGSLLFGIGVQADAGETPARKLQQEERFKNVIRQFLDRLREGNLQDEGSESYIPAYLKQWVRVEPGLDLAFLLRQFIPEWQLDALRRQALHIEVSYNPWLFAKCWDLIPGYLAPGLYYFD
jgi:hypothetical protein